jgi:hypothetical protein
VSHEGGGVTPGVAGHPWCGFSSSGSAEMDS